MGAVSLLLVEAAVVAGLRADFGFAAIAGWHVVLTVTAGHAGRWITPPIRRELAIGGRVIVPAIAAHLALG